VDGNPLSKNVNCGIDVVTDYGALRNFCRRYLHHPRNLTGF